MEYAQLLLELYSLAKGRAMRMGLERMEAMVDALQIEIRALRVVHVGGTNGKGSVATKIAKACELGGYKVGLYTSPHISSFRERFQICGQMISKEALICLYQEVQLSLLKTGISPTFFELTTLLCFKWFLQEKVDIAVVEVGLGGRLDATNICHSILQVITSVDFDHTEILGGSLEAIAYEKAGIIKPGGIAILGPSVPVFAPVFATEVPVIRVLQETDDYEEENQAIAKTALQELMKLGYRLEASIEIALLQKPPCRFEEVKEGLFLDVAHNPHGVAALVRRVKRHISQEGSKKWVACCGFSQDKDVIKILKILLPHVESVYFIKAESERALSVEALLELYPQGKCGLDTRETVSTAIDEAKRLQCPCVIFGSFYIMNSVRQVLGISAEVDPQPVGEVWKYSKTYST